jgi:hypothetical protein
VHEQKIVHASNNWRYCSLSYVWGTIPSLSLTKYTLPRMTEPGSLSTMRNQLSRVIRDAMDVVASIGERYLWADSLCIIQDDEDHKHNQISHMDSIYSEAILTIVSLSAKDASKPLLPIQNDDTSADEFARAVEFIQKERNIEICRLESCSNIRTLASAMATSTYETRGWCFQERILSKRVLYTTDILHFHCCTEVRVSTFPFTKIEHTDALNLNLLSVKIQDPLSSERIPFVRYTWLVETYTPRIFSHPADILKAFSGLMGALGKLKDRIPIKTFLCGLPCQNMAIALMWRHRPSSRSAPVPERRVVSADVNKTTIWPTWSWAAWYGAVQCTFLKENRRVGNNCSEELQFVGAMPIANGSFDAVGLNSAEGIVQSTTTNKMLEWNKRSSWPPSHIDQFYVLHFWADTIEWIFTPLEGWEDIWDRDVVKLCRNNADRSCGKLWLRSLDSSSFFQPEKLRFAKALRMKNYYYFLLVRQRQDICERVGVGIISVQAWNEAGPSRELICLA